MADSPPIPCSSSVVRVHWARRCELGNGCSRSPPSPIYPIQKLMYTQLSNGVISVPSFQRDFGYEFENKYIISASWQIAFNTASSIGGFFGAIIAGYLADRIGKRMTLGIGCIVSIGAVFIQVFASTASVLLVGKVRFSRHPSRDRSNLKSYSMAYPSVHSYQSPPASLLRYVLSPSAVSPPPESNFSSVSVN
jgi:hypothetical protein